MNLNLKMIFKSFFLLVLTLLLSVTVLYAATTIGSNIATGGNITVAPDYGLDASSAGVMNIGTTTATTINIGGSQALTKILGNASTTMVSLSDSLWVGGNATTTSAGAISTGSTLNVSGDTTLSTASSTGLVKIHQLKIATTGSTLVGMAFGYCTAASANITATTTGMVSCTGATGVLSGDRVFIQATSSLPNSMVIQAASTTANEVIQVDIFNAGDLAGTVASGINSFNFWAVR